ncbi:leucine-rich repeat-containing protein 71-like [Onthophagus taurus]|uniref:leucine-rich repeat-containing protein 71-like n=1 Tax=Onthophagus taurus TaxID=166361 RepID=UPI0039BDB0AC
MSKSGISSITGLSSSKLRRNSKKQSTISTNDGFKEMFYDMCQELNMESFPTIKCLLSEPTPFIFQEVGSAVEVASRQSSIASKRQSSKQLDMNPSRTESEITTTDEEIRLIYPFRDSATSLICKQFKMKDAIMGALQKTLPKFDTIRVLKLEFCQLTLPQVKAIKFLLVANPNIIDVSLDGNYIPKHPQYILGKGTNIRHLSLRFCKLTDKGVFRFKRPLQSPYERTILTLNLSSNLITDVGAKHLADELRTNRTLMYLNLSDNLITDVGLIHLMKTLRKFPLNHEEIVLRRQKNLHRLQLKEEIRYDITKSRKSDSNLSSVSLIKSDTSSKRSCSSARMRVATTSSQRRRSSADSHKSLESLILSKLPKDPYPFVYECSTEDKNIYCSGNSRLQCLNLSFNKITDDGLDFVKDTLRELQLQRVFAEDGENRLLKIILYGNSNIKYPEMISNKSSSISSKSASSGSKASSRSSVKERRMFASKIII